VKATIVGCLLLLAALCTGVVCAAEPVKGVNAPSTDVRLVESREEKILLDFVLPPWSVQEEVVDGITYQRFHVSGWGHTTEAGKPQLPVRSVLLGIPVNAAVEVEVYDSEEVVWEGYRIYPTPSYVVAPQLPDTELSWPLLSSELPMPVFTKDEQVYGADAFYPAEPVAIGSSGYLRHQRFVRVELRPFRYNPVTGQLMVRRHMKIALNLTYPQGRASTAAQWQAEPAGFEELLRSSILNYESARAWRMGSRHEDGQIAGPDIELPPYKVFVEQDGLYQLTYSDLEEAGLPVGDLNPQTLQIFNKGHEVAIRVIGEGDGSFDQDDYILFYGRKNNTQYTDVNVYWLAFDQEMGRRMEERDGTPGSAPVPESFWTAAHLEEDLRFLPRYPESEDGDHWFWNYVYPPSIPSQTYITTLENLGGASYDATVTMHVLGGAEIPHTVEISFNGNYVGDVSWAGLGPITPTVAFPSAFLQEGNNEIVLASPNAEDLFYVDWLEIGYRDTYRAESDQLYFSIDMGDTWDFEISGFLTESLAVYDITEPVSPAHVVNVQTVPIGAEFALRFQDSPGPETQYLALSPSHWLGATIEGDTPSDWLSPDNGADYIIITPHEFYADVLPLAEYRALQGLRVAVVELQDVYDEFWYGLLDAKAIRAFLSYAYEYWEPPAPSYVVLVGDGSFDFKDVWGAGEPNPLPPYLAYVDPWIGLVAADNRYVMIAGEDILPEMYIGRLPVNDSAQVQTMVSKIITYEGAPDADWHANLVFYTDDADEAGDFPYLSDLVADHLVPPPYTVNKIYLGETCTPAGTCRDQFLEAVNETGALMVNYVGHAGPQIWASESLFTVGDLPELTNGDKMPIHLPMTCNDGYFTIPGYPSLGESAVRIDGRGAVASWSPSGLGLATGHDRLNRGFFRAVLMDGVRELGQAAVSGKLWLYASGENLDLVDTYHVFGDPALRLRALDTDLRLAKAVEPVGQVEPGDMLTYTLTFANDGPAVAHHVVLTDVVPSVLLSPTVLYASPEVLTQHTGITFAWSIADLLPGDSGEIRFSAQVDPQTEPTAVTNYAEITSAEPDINPSNNIVSVTTGVQVPDLYVYKVGPEVTAYSQTITYTITWGNRGEAAAPNVRLTDTLPALVTYVDDDNVVEPYQPSLGVLVWEITPNPVPTDTEETFVVTVQVTAEQYVDDWLVNRVRIGADMPDGSPTDNHDEWITVLEGQRRIYLPVVFKEY
jgi:uncharacterized repeat protein (TIGR01451 family)